MDFASRKHAVHGRWGSQTRDFSHEINGGHLGLHGHVFDAVKLCDFGHIFAGAHLGLKPLVCYGHVFVAFGYFLPLFYDFFGIGDVFHWFL